KNPESRWEKRKKKGDADLAARIACREGQRERSAWLHPSSWSSRTRSFRQGGKAGPGQRRSVRKTGLGRESAVGHARGPRCMPGLRSRRRRCRRRRNAKPLAARRRRVVVARAEAAVRGAMTQRCLRSPSVNFADCESPLPGDTFGQPGRRCYAPGRVSTETPRLATPNRQCGVV
ncbi:unnamed protein product, partial [Ixodes hexagonus]